MRRPLIPGLGVTGPFFHSTPAGNARCHGHDQIAALLQARSA
jgi:hypothetical protein